MFCVVDFFFLLERGIEGNITTKTLVVCSLIIYLVSLVGVIQQISHKVVHNESESNTELNSIVLYSGGVRRRDFKNSCFVRTN